MNPDNRQEVSPRWREIEADTSKLSTDLREIQKTVQDYGHRLINIPMKIEQMNQKVDEILRILPDLKYIVADLKKEVSDLKGKRAGHSGTSKQERIRDAFGPVPLLHQKGKAKEIPRPKTQEERINEILRSIH